MTSLEQEIDAVADAIATTAAMLDAGEHRLLELIREFDTRNGWAVQGAVSCAQWLSWRVGMGIGSARERVRVALALGELPLINEALRLGELSFCKVRALTRVATPAIESELVDIARACTGAQLETICRLYRGAQDQLMSAAEQAERERELQYRRRVQVQHTARGTVVLRVELPADEGHVLVRQLEAVQSQLGAQAKSDVGTGTDAGTASASPRIELIDALMHIVEGGDAARVHHQVQVHASLADLRMDPDEGAQDSLPTPAHIDFETGISKETVCRLCCDTAWRPVLESADGQVLGEGRQRRCVSGRLRRALELRDDGRCQYPGCHHTRHVEAHHIGHWIDGGSTDLDNLVSLCRRHHRWLHEGGCRIEVLDDGGLRFIDAGGQQLESAPRRERLVEAGIELLESVHRASGVCVSAESSACGWDGERIDARYVVDELLYLARGRTECVSLPGS